MLLFLLSIALICAGSMWRLSIGILRRVSDIRVSHDACGSCGYSMVGLGAQSACPECGNSGPRVESAHSASVRPGASGVFFVICPIAFVLHCVASAAISFDFTAVHVWNYELLEALMLVAVDELPEALMLTAILNALGFITMLVGLMFARRYSPKYLKSLAIASSSAMLVGWIGTLLIQAASGPDEGFPFYWILAVMVQPIMSGAGACAVAWRARP